MSPITAIPIDQPATVTFDTVAPLLALPWLLGIKPGTGHGLLLYMDI
jgi:hypothetical protein